MIVHKPSGKLLLNLNNPTRVTTVIPSARTFEHQGHHIVAVPHREDEVRVLRNLGMDAPAPIEHHYDWPGRHAPYAHQKITSAFLTLNPWSFCLNGMGSGKTLSVLWAFHYLVTRSMARRMLVVAPLSTLVRTWADEVFSNFPELTVAVLHGTMDRRLKLLAVPHDIYVINHDGIKSKEMLQALVNRDDIDVVAVDELASFRTVSTERFKAAHRLVADRKYVWGLTGTPTPNDPTDAFAQCRLIAPTRVPRYFGAFREQVMRKVTQFKWLPRDGALDIVKQAMQPAIRFSREECIDLPPTTYQTREVELTPEQRRAFDDMVRAFKAEYAGGQILAVNEAVKLGKLVQICCLKGDTLTLTRRGWVPLTDVRLDDAVWDGQEWVRHGGLVYRGRRRTINRGGVRLTPDHLVLAPRGWVDAERIFDANAGGGLDWAEVRLPPGVAPRRVDTGEDSVRDLAVPLRLRSRSSARQPEPQKNDAPEWAALRVPGGPVESDTRYGGYAALQNLEPDEPPVLRPIRQGLAALRRAWRHSVRCVEGVVRVLLVRHTCWVRPALVSRPEGQRRPLLAGELPVGDAKAAGSKPADHDAPRHATRSDDADGRSRGVRNCRRDAAAQADDLQVVGGPGADDAREEVYDLTNCGPRSRFTVRGPGQRPMLVHNCGVAYSPGGEEVVLPCAPRIDVVREIIEEADAKVIVFVPYTGALRHLAAALAKDFSVEIVDGGTSRVERDRIFGAFQKQTNPRVIVAQAGTMSHGLTLTAANTIVWYGAPTSNEIYMQANERISRPGQKHNTLIVHVESTPVEQKMFDRLRKKGTMQGALLEMLKGE